MNHSFRRPLLSAVRFSSTFETRRCFSQVHPQWAARQEPTMLGPRQRAERSVSVLSKEQMAMPSDIGVLQGTFVTPLRNNLLYNAPRDFLAFQWMRAKTRLQDILSLLVLKISSPAEKRWYHRQLKLRRRQVAPTAMALHREMYTAFAAGDVRTLRKICTDGIYESFEARIGARKRGERVQWDLVRYDKSPRLVSNRGVRLPMEGAGIRQAVVRICSTQRLTRYQPDGEVIQGTGKEKKVVEYVVIQKTYWNWKEEDWRIWGTTEETTMKDVEEWKRQKLAETR